MNRKAITSPKFIVPTIIISLLILIPIIYGATVSITITSPENNTYENYTIFINATFNTTSNITYDWDGEGNISGCFNCTLQLGEYGETTSINTDGLIHLWHLNEGNGDYRYDEVNKSNYTLNQNGFIPQCWYGEPQCKFGGCVRILNDPNCKFLTTGENTVSFPNSDFTIVMFYENTDADFWDGTDNVYRLMSIKPNGSVNAWGFGYGANSGWLGSGNHTYNWFNYNGSYNNYYSNIITENISINEWHCASISRNTTSNELTFHHNGVNIGSTSYNATVEENVFDLFLGAGYEAGGDIIHEYHKGEIDEVSIYNKTLTTSEILEICNKTISNGLHNLTIYANNSGDINKSVRYFTVNIDTQPSFISPINNDNFEGLKKIDWNDTCSAYNITLRNQSDLSDIEYTLALDITDNWTYNNSNNWNEDDYTLMVDCGNNINNTINITTFYHWSLYQRDNKNTGYFPSSINVTGITKLRNYTHGSSFTQGCAAVDNIVACGSLNGMVHLTNVSDMSLICDYNTTSGTLYGPVEAAYDKFLIHDRTIGIIAINYSCDQQWNFSTSDPDQPFVIEDGIIYSCEGSPIQAGTQVYAIHENGSMKWNYSLGTRCAGIVLNGDELYVGGSLTDVIHVLDKSDGTQLYNNSVTDLSREGVGFSFDSDNNVLYKACSAGNVFRAYNQSDNFTEVWNDTASDDIFTEGAIYQDHVTYGTQDNWVKKRDALDGSFNYTINAGDDVSSSVVITNNNLLLYINKGTTFTIKDYDDGGAVDSFSVDGSNNFRSSTIIYKDKVYLATDLAIHQLGQTNCTDGDGDGYNLTGGSGCGIADCNDSNSDIYQNLTGYLDADLDTWTTGGALTVCSGAALPSGYKGSQSANDDCDDSDNTTYPYDGTDNYVVNTTRTFCGNSFAINDTTDNGVFNISEDNVILDCNGTTILGNSSGKGAYITNVDNFTIQGCVFDSYNKTIDVETSENSTIFNNTIYNYSTDGIEVDDGFHVDVNFNILQFNKTGGASPITGIDGWRCHNLTIRNNVMRDTTEGFSTVTSFSNYTTWYNNTILDSHTCSLVADYGTHANITGNNITLNNPEQGTLNICGINLDGANVRCENCTVADNYVEIALTNGINFFNGAYNCSVFNNTLKVGAYGGGFAGIGLMAQGGLMGSADSIKFYNNSVFGYNDTEDCEMGLFSRNASNILFANNTVNNCSVGIGFSNQTENITVYNNLFNASIMVQYGTFQPFNYITGAVFNVTQQTGPNIIGGQDIGGNFWTDYIGFDNDTDGIGDVPNTFIINASLGLYDYLPLTNNDVACADNDSDGYGTSYGSVCNYTVNDCDDNNATIHPLGNTSVTLSGEHVICTDTYYINDSINAITIQSDSFVDLNGSVIIGNGTESGVAFNGFSNSTVRNGTVINYTVGVRGDGANLLTIEDMRISDIGLIDGAGGHGYLLSATPNSKIINCYANQTNSSGINILSGSHNTTIDNYIYESPINSPSFSVSTINITNVTIINSLIEDIISSSSIGSCDILTFQNNTLKSDGSANTLEINCNNSNNFLFTNNTLINGAIGINVDNSNNITLNDTRIYNMTSNGIQTSGNNGIFTNLIIDNVTNSGIFLTSRATNNTVSNNNISAITLTGIRINNATNNTISGNTINDTVSDCIYLDTGANNNIVSGNNVSEADDGSGIRIDNSYNNTISSNTFTNTNGISFENADNNTASSNTILNAPTDINFETSNNNIITGNTGTNATENSLYLEDSDNNTIINNIFESQTIEQLFRYYTNISPVTLEGVDYTMGWAESNATLWLYNLGGGLEDVTTENYLLDGDDDGYVDGTQNFSLFASDLSGIGGQENTTVISSSDIGWTNCTDVESVIGGGNCKSFCYNFFIANGSGNDYILNDSCFNATFNITSGYTSPAFAEYREVAVFNIEVDSDSDNNTLYNNVFNSTIGSVKDGGTGNVWNTTKSEETNILGNAWIGGNYYDEYTGTDSDGDYLGDTQYSGNGFNDSLPLTLTTLYVDPTGGSVGGGPGGSCSENWACEEWSECDSENYTRTRECNDINDCDTQYNMPNLVELCIPGEDLPNGTSISLSFGNRFGIMLYSLINFNFQLFFDNVFLSFGDKFWNVDGAYGILFTHGFISLIIFILIVYIVYRYKKNLKRWQYLGYLIAFIISILISAILPIAV